MTNIYENILNGSEKISIIGLGYVGMPIAVAFAKKVNVLGFDLNAKKIAQYKAGIDPTREVGDEAIQQSNVEFTDNPTDLKSAKFHIVAVPTPVDEHNIPDLSPLESASEIVGENLVKDAIVVFESTVFPGATEEICVPILEKTSGLKCGVDFKVGYSPERINPGDKVHRLETIVKVVAGMDNECLDIIAKVYELVVEAGVHRASTIKVAEAAKVIENAQRDINIAFMNELSNIFHALNIDTKEVLEAASTKWNFLNFTPGLVGGHCIGVDPYYLAFKAQQAGYHPQVILSGRRINDGMGKMVADDAVKLLMKNGKNPGIAKIGIFGFTFKENCPDTRNTKVIDIIEEFQGYGIAPLVYDPEADRNEAEDLYHISLADESEMIDLDLIIIAVNHSVFATKEQNYWLNRVKDKKVIMDLKGILNKKELESNGVSYWRL